MFRSTKSREQWISQQMLEITGRPLKNQPVVFEDTSAYMSIERDDIIDLDGELYLVRCNERELRCGLSDQPKFWVKRSMYLENGDVFVLKLVVREEFTARIGNLEMKCSRDEEKEGRVLERVRGDSRFMQGHSVPDAAGNLVRVIEFIRGPSLIDYLHQIDLPHEEYFDLRFPEILGRTIGGLEAIQFLHDVGLHHGDIRSDHILVESTSGDFKWIDFDLTQDYPDYDLAGVGNILHVIVGKQLIRFREILRAQPSLSSALHWADGASLFPHRVMNLHEVFPYVPKKLNDILMRFSIGASLPYESIGQVVDDLKECASSKGWPIIDRPNSVGSELDRQSSRPSGT